MAPRPNRNQLHNHHANQFPVNPSQVWSRTLPRMKMSSIEKLERQPFGASSGNDSSHAQCTPTSGRGKKTRRGVTYSKNKCSQETTRYSPNECILKIKKSKYKLRIKFVGIATYSSMVTSREWNANYLKLLVPAAPHIIFLHAHRIKISGNYTHQPTSTPHDRQLLPKTPTYINHSSFCCPCYINFPNHLFIEAA